MTTTRHTWSWFLLLPLFALGLAACGDYDDDDDTTGGARTAVAGATLGTTPESTPDDEAPEANEIPELVRDGLERAFGDAEWFNDVTDIERDGDTVRFKLDRDFATDREAFEDSCNAIADLVMDTGILDVETIEAEDEDGAVVMTAEGESTCRPAAG